MKPIRPAVPADVPEILRLVVELAEYEREPDAVAATEEGFLAALFGDEPAVHAFVIDGEEAGTLAGMAVWFLTFSTWEGVHGIHLEDLYVRPAHRGGGYGTALLTSLAALCVERGYARLEWDVLDWNAPAIGFYESLAARPLDGWTTYRLDGAALRRA
ncbi:MULTISPECIES: GNAT family N-acetyltransferase [Cryobacterium]|uniref:GNAT family N-acetyltransferase n=1 Tax=Cryobacterium glucosi TaxID=1259175 RepID=A0ABY2ITB5_9MICO|nr:MULTISPECIES: GNAT family N-acetyltransferase [Cryobacterium]MDY7527784.1 GNAT family N-acetyltransferase [Cryobacterium sp. 10C2]MDY7556444.1 GNAT family N-acetyltransferase [Cryobacterium sp. 10C3]MEB0001715.1 GNAT family N-acetyltransferase [Cryobacterium sp. RTC2.1]MEB0200187.1 GNAT family N-acetyltransferase [Cryobacterium sp. 5I3]MEB0285089.1 GNAT family N-acetyltransferase [Cryobacterium sp. 10S3]